MGYTHYFYTKPDLNKAYFLSFVTDFKKMMQPLKLLGVKLADGRGENTPIVRPDEIIFNGMTNCGHIERDMGITWPSKTAKGINQNKVGTQLQELVSGKWFAGAQLESRVCDGDCSHETFHLQQKAENLPDYKKVSEDNGYIFDCTKTAYKPYDLAVNVALIIAKHHLKTDIIIRSDGEEKDWEEGRQLCQHFLGFGKDFKLDEDQELLKEN